jgi:deoxycytidine triphosphate deaminase
MLYGTHHGGVLSGGEIELLGLIEENFDRASVRRAGYDVRIGPSAITADGTKEFSNVEQVILEPGQSAVVPTEELFRLPPNVAGNIALKTRAASEGLLLLSGLLVDPEYEGPLHLSVANVGSNAFVLRQGDHVASVQFFPVVGAPVRMPLPLPKSASPRRPLAFLGQLARVRNEFDGLQQTVSRTADLTTTVITLGFFLVGATILGVTLSTLLSIVADKDLVASLRSATPHSVTGKLLVAVSIFSAAWAVYSVSLLIRVIMRPGGPTRSG